MRYIIFLNLLMLTAFSNPLQAQADAIETYFGQHIENEDFTVIYVSSKMFSLISKVEINVDEPEAQVAIDMMKDIKGLRMLMTEKDAMMHYKEAISSINTDEYEVLMTVRDEEDNIRFWVKENTIGEIEELLLLIGSEDEFTLLSFVGKIDLAKIGQLSNQLNINGVEHLDKIENQ